jgi:hypothetical protein
MKTTIAYQSLETLRQDLKFAEEVVDKSFDLCFDTAEGYGLYVAANKYRDSVFNKLNQVEKSIYQQNTIS